jgi:hypothetical protein
LCYRQESSCGPLVVESNRRPRKKVNSGGGVEVSMVERWGCNVACGSFHNTSSSELLRLSTGVQNIFECQDGSFSDVFLVFE